MAIKNQSGAFKGLCLSCLNSKGRAHVVMKSFLIVCAVLATPTAAMAQVSGAITECLPALEGQGFAVTGMDVEGDELFEFEAVRDGVEWEIKTNDDCEVLIQQPES